METMWKERADYGHFFYRIPNGESAADAYDRVSGFNETLFRSFQEEDFPSVCVLVTHGLMTRVFLMRWYHWSVEYFEDLRNVNHCEMVIMERTKEHGKFKLQTPLRTWSELKRMRAAEKNEEEKKAVPTSPNIPVRRAWNVRRQDSIMQAQETIDSSGRLWGQSESNADDEEAFPNLLNTEQQSDTNVEPPVEGASSSGKQHHVAAARGFKGSASGTATPLEGDEIQQQVKPSYFETKDNVDDHEKGIKRDKNKAPTDEEREQWTKDSGMGSGARAERLGDARRDSDDGGNLSDQEKHDKSVEGNVY